MSANSSRTRRTSLRICSGVIALVFVVAAVALPLFAEMMNCSMPCCHPETSPVSSYSVATINPCQTDCEISSARAATQQTVTTSATPEAASAGIGDVLVASASWSKPVCERFVQSMASRSPRGIEAPLHLLNSTFRI